MPSVRTSISIAAPPARVWAALTDFPRYPEWNQIIQSMRGEPRVGASVRFRIHIEATPALRFAAKVVRCVPEREFAWCGGAPVIPSIASGDHWFRLEPDGDGTLLTHGEDFTGLLDLVVRGFVHARITRTYDRFNAALKARVEAQSGA